MFGDRRFRHSDPFRLSALGRCRAVAAWFLGPALMRRWQLILLSLTTAACFGAILVVLVVVHAAPRFQPPAASHEPDDALAAMLRVGPSSSTVTDLPGYECHPMPTLGLKYIKTMRIGPSVVAIDSDGVVWGPSCVVTYGVAG